MFLPNLDTEVIYLLYLTTIDLLISKYKKKCICAAKHANENKEFEPVYKTCVIYAKQHFERIKKLNECRHEFIQNKLLIRGKK